MSLFLPAIEVSCCTYLECLSVSITTNFNPNTNGKLPLYSPEDPRLLEGEELDSPPVYPLKWNFIE